MVYDSNGSVSLEAILQSGNLYAYCMGNPVKFKDFSGDSVILTCLIGAAVSIAAQYASDVIVNYVSGKRGVDAWTPIGTIGDYVSAGITGAIPGGKGWAVFARIVSGGVISQGLDALIYQRDWDWGKFLFDSALSGTSEGISKFFSAKQLRFIRDIKDEAIHKGIKGTKRLNEFLAKKQFKADTYNTFVDFLASLTPDAAERVAKMLIGR